MRKCRKGFTLIEIAIVLAIFGILLAVMFPKLQKPLAQYQLRSTSIQLASDMRLVRQQSIFGRAYVVNLQVSPQEGFYSIRDSASVVVQRFLPPGIHFKEVILDKNTLNFSLTGAPSSAGRIGLTNNFGETCYVYFMPSSGRIRVDCSGDK
ncbi:MAG: prepilin-type N-terminal cleavage/methylation domain-containing protein [Clostridia bacterium]|jgi:prepilin-type N-terminal cleavage/methylation domain-containing protein|nr:prepilin-type N-terminal cleavage/methylation domain-containing protein [Clostridia bacterium]